MTKEELNHYKNLISEKRDNLLMEIKGRKKEDSDKENSNEIQYTFHMADQGTDTMEKEKKYYFASLDGELLRYLDQALDRIEIGTYGICTECNQLIAKERLEALPHALKCIQCKASEELSQ